jgi:hypothetical protein
MTTVKIKSEPVPEVAASTEPVTESAPVSNPQQ